MLNKMRMAHKLWLAVALIVVMLVGVVGFSGYRSARVQAASEAVQQEMDVRIGAAVRWMALTETNAARTLAVVLSSDPAVEAEFKDQITATSAEISKTQKALEAMALSDAGKAQMARIAEARKIMIGLRGEAQKLKAASKNDEAIVLVKEKYTPAATAYLQTLRDFVQQQQDEAHTTLKAMAGERMLTVKIAAGVVALLVVAIVCGAFFLIRSIVEPLDAANAVAARIAQGDLSMPPAVDRQDEFGDLLRAQQAMCESLGRLVRQVRQSTDNIAIASAEIAAGNHDLSARTEQTSSNLQQTAATMEEFTSTIQQSAGSAQQASQLAAGASGVARRGGEVVTEVVATMNDIHQSSQKIADIIGVIDGIAFQTNILALNAAVEAARAGEQGRGFAVVASEVRSLAQRSAEAAKEIKQLIGVSVERVEAGSRLVADAGSTMTEIVQSVQRVTDMIGEITAASSEQSAGVGQVNHAIGNLDQMTQQNAALVEESAAAAQSLREQADQLAQVVSVFKVDGGPQAAAFAAAPAPGPRSAAPRPVSVSGGPSGAVLAAAARRAAASPAPAPPRAQSAARLERPALAKAVAPAASSPSPSPRTAAAAQATSDEDWESF